MRLIAFPLLLLLLHFCVEERLRSAVQPHLAATAHVSIRSKIVSASKQLDRPAIQINEIPSVYGKYKSVEELKKDLLSKY